MAVVPETTSVTHRGQIRAVRAKLRGKAVPAVNDPAPDATASNHAPPHFDSATFYVTFDNHRNDDYTPYVFTTTNFGRTFTSIVNNLPKGQTDFVHVIREDPKNQDLLFAGTDVGAYVSIDRGQSWQRVMSGLGTTPVHDLIIHPRDGELIAGTHGRPMWIADITPL